MNARTDRPRRLWAVALAALIATPAAARSLGSTLPGDALLHRSAGGGTVGVNLADVPPDVVGVRWHLRVNASMRHVNRKIVFLGVRTQTPGDPGAGTLDMDVVTDWLEYRDDLGHAGWPEQGVEHADEPSLWVRNVDYGGVGRVGLKPTGHTARALFPRQTAGIDRTTPEHASLTSISAIHQGSILGRDLDLTLVREPLLTFATPQLDWGHRFTATGGVTAVLPAGRYWPWRLTIRPFGEPSVDVLLLVDESRGRYVMPAGGVSVTTEFFFRPDVPENLLGVLQLFVWDVETLREGTTTWEPRPRWLYSRDATPNAPPKGYGFRKALYAGHEALEVSYSGDDAYIPPGGVIDLDDEHRPAH